MSTASPVPAPSFPACAARGSQGPDPASIHAPQSGAPGPAGTAGHPLRHRPFLILWIGSSLSLIGDQFYLVTLPWIVLQLTGSGVAMGTVAMAAGIPRAVLMLLGGAVTDRTSPRRVIMATAAVRTIVVAAIGVLLELGGLRLWHVCALAVVFGTADAFALPSSGAMLRSVVEPDQLPAANSVWQSSALITSAVGPAPAGWIVKILGAAWAFFLDAVSFLFILGALAMLPDPPVSRSAAPKPKVWASIKEGLAYVGRDVALRSLMLLAAVLNFCLSGPLSVGLAYLAGQRFASPSAFGLWISSVAAGTLAGMLLAGVLKSKRRGRLLLGTSALLGAATCVMSFLPGLWPVAAMLALMGAASGFINVQIQAWFQQRVDRAYLGRVVSVAMLASFGLMPISMAAAGALVEWSPTGLFVLAGAAVIAVSAFGLLQRPVREIA